MDRRQPPCPRERRPGPDPAESRRRRSAGGVCGREKRPARRHGSSTVAGVRVIAQRTASMSKALSLVNGRGMSVRLSTTAPSTRISKQPLRGFSALIEILAPGTAALTSASTLAARLLKAPQDLQASISTPAPDDDGGAAFGAAFVLAAAGFFTMVFFGAMVGALKQCESGRRRARAFYMCGSPYKKTSSRGHEGPPGVRGWPTSSPLPLSGGVPRVFGGNRYYFVMGHGARRHGSTPREYHLRLILLLPLQALCLPGHLCRGYYRDRDIEIGDREIGYTHTRARARARAAVS